MAAAQEHRGHGPGRPQPSRRLPRRHRYSTAFHPWRHHGPQHVPGPHPSASRLPAPPWAEIIGLSWYDPDTGQASPPDFPEAPGGGHNIHLDILDVTTAPVTVHHIGLDDAERAALALTHDGSLDATLTHDNPHKRRLARAQLIDDQLHRRAEAATLKARLAAEHADLGYQARRRERREILRAALRTGHHRA